MLGFRSLSAARRLPAVLPSRLSAPRFSSHGIIYSKLHFQPVRSAHTESNALTLIQAVQSKNTNAIAEIAKEKPKILIEEQTNNDNTALHEAARVGDVAMILELAKQFTTNFKVNHKCHCLKKRTPLAYAVEGGHENAVDALFELGAGANITDEKGWTALDYAIQGLKSGKNNTAFENIISKILEKEGTSNKFPEEAKRIILQIEATKREKLKVESINSFLNSHRDKLQQETGKYVEEYLTEVKRLR